MKVTDPFYAAIGAPVLAGRKALELGGKALTAAREGLEASATEGRSVFEDLTEGNVVEELTHRFEVDERVGKLREQVEGVFDRWREGFHAEKKAAAKKPAAKKAPEAPEAKKDDAPEKVEVTA